MKSVKQTRFGYPKGNCLMACAASILEVPLEDLPDLFDECCEWDGENAVWRDGDWWTVFIRTCREYGWEPLFVSGRADEIAPPGYHIATGDSPRPATVRENGENAGHAIVCLDGEPVHDPHPDDDGLAGSIESWILMIPPK